LVNFHEIQQESHATVGDLGAILFNPVVSTIPKWRMFKLPKWTQNLDQSTWDQEILYADRYAKDKQLLISPFLWEKSKTKNMENTLKQKLVFYFMEAINEPLHLRQLKFGAVKVH
jgi:hypothetical protein